MKNLLILLFLAGASVGWAKEKVVQGKPVFLMTVLSAFDTKDEKTQAVSHWAVVDVRVKRHDEVLLYQESGKQYGMTGRDYDDDMGSVVVAFEKRFDVSTIKAALKQILQDRAASTAEHEDR
ncbi:MAG TPA: hypothetical protein VHE12_05760 [bacterium]|nr:hypothetical protein [bacterium]